MDNEIVFLASLASSDSAIFFLTTWIYHYICCNVGHV